MDKTPALVEKVEGSLGRFRLINTKPSQPPSTFLNLPPAHDDRTQKEKSGRL
jgi:hypothetical protein